MSDYIERDKAIEKLKENVVEMGGDDFSEMGVHIDDIESVINSIPSARPNNRGVCGVCAGRKVCGENNRNLDMLECSIFELDEHYKISRPKGEWIDRSDGGRILHPWWESYECNQCGYEGSGAWNFCPNCGSDNREREGE